jgi:hypothetical protein
MLLLATSVLVLICPVAVILPVNPMPVVVIVLPLIWPVAVKLPV